MASQDNHRPLEFDSTTGEYYLPLPSPHSNLRLTPYRPDSLYRYYTLSVDMGTDLLGDMVKPCQGHMSPRSLDNPPLPVPTSHTVGFQ